MKLSIIGDGTFGNFLRELLAPYFEITEDAHSVILAVSIRDYPEVAKNNKDRHLINVCSTQNKSTDYLLAYTRRVTSIHPLFGPRTPTEYRNSILTHCCHTANEDMFLVGFNKVSRVHVDFNGEPFTPKLHDKLMARTHKAAMHAARDLAPYVEAAKDVPDHLIPHSFRLLRQFVKTLEDMPKGTLESIMANPYRA